MKASTRRTMGEAKEAPPPLLAAAAELILEQCPAEQASAHGKGRATAGEAQVQPFPSAVPADAPAHSWTEAVPEA
jgi:hypothetical protein